MGNEVSKNVPGPTRKLTVKSINPTMSKETSSDPLDKDLSPERSNSLREALRNAATEADDPDPELIMCPWKKETSMHTWIVIIMGKFQVQHCYIEANFWKLTNNQSCTKMNGQQLKKYTSEFKNLAVICFTAAVNGPALYNTHTLGRGGSKAVLTNSRFYEKLEEPWGEENWNRLIISPVAEWMSKSFLSQPLTDMKARQEKISGQKRSASDSANPAASNLSKWFTASELKNTNVGSTCLHYFNKRNILISREITLDSDLRGESWSCFGSMLTLR